MADQQNEKIDADLTALFGDTAAPDTGRSCRKCGAAAGVEAKIRFCSYCGAPLDPLPVKRVLIVDDSSLSRKTIGAILQQLGCEVLEAADGPHALEMARVQPLVLIVLDVVMPGMSGLEFLKVLREYPATARTPVIMLTSKADLSTVHQALSTGASDYLLKHSAPEDIRQRLQKHLGP